MKIVCDTNVLISGVLFGGNPRRVLELLLEGKADGAISESIEQEFRAVLERRKFGIKSEQIELICQELDGVFEKVTPARKVNAISEDPADNEILACALEAEADVIVSGDPHLLTLDIFEGIRVLSPAQLVQELQ